jgi:hypothetical protein
MRLEDAICYYENMAANSLSAAKDYRELADWLTELADFRNSKNWARSYDENGNLTPEFALFLPKLEINSVNS